MSKRVLSEVIRDPATLKRPRKSLDALDSMNHNPTQKKLVISLRAAPVLAIDFEQKRWAALKEAMKCVFSSQKTGWTLQELYSAVEDLVEHSKAPWLYNLVEVELNAHILSLREKLKLLSTDNPTTFLRQLHATWATFADQMILIRQIFLVLDRRFALASPTLLPLWELSLRLFANLVFGDSSLSCSLTRSLIKLIESDRNREQVDRLLLRSLIRMLTSLRLYEKLFETPLLEETKRYYSLNAEAYFTDHTVPEFLSYIDELIATEKSRGQALFESTTTSKTMEVVYDVVVRSFVTRLLEKGFETLLDTSSQPHLAILFNVLERVGRLGDLTTPWNTYLKKRGGDIVQDTSRDAHLIEDLINFKTKIDATLEGPFKRLDPLSYALKEAMEHVVNLRTNSVAELLAKYIDSKLKTGKSSRSVSEMELEPMLDSLVQIFRYIGSKDVFEAFYKKDLAKRLLLNKCLSVDIEKLMVSKLKAECGANYTSKLEGMFKDMELSEDLNSRFKKSPQYTPMEPLRIDSRVLVLSTGLQDHQNAFNAFYAAQYAGRRLQWQNSLSHCVIRAQFSGSGQKLELHLSLYQAVAILCFETTTNENSHSGISLKHLIQRTQMERGELVRTLKSLSRKQLPLLLRNGDQSGSENDEKDDTSFVFHNDFRSKTLRVHVNAIQVREGQEERTKTNEGITKERIYALDAAIVRVMKARKTLTHSELVQEVIRALGGRFTPQPHDIKARVESLIEREFVKRDESNHNVFHYLA